tara:strand:+ start:134 stop:421 length:288 start_codon:yes stop_codon:yes gene_type:complete
METNFFFIQYQYNISILLKNVSKKFNINIDTLNKFYPKDFSLYRNLIIKNNNAINLDITEYSLKKKKIYCDKNSNKYILICNNENTNIYNSIKIS